VTFLKQYHDDAIKSEYQTITKDITDIKSKYEKQANYIKTLETNIASVEKECQEIVQYIEILESRHQDTSTTKGNNS